MSSAPHPNQLQPGDFIDKYRIVGVAGSGGFSRVFQVERNGHLYAVKMATTPASAEDLDRVDGWLRREAVSMERFVHPHLLPVYEMGRWPDPRTGYSFYVTDYVPGVTLRDLLRHSELEPSQWVGVVCDLLLALEALHEAGVVHRDLKADNVLVREEDGQVFLIDLGSAHLPGARPLTERVAPGTLYCLPPEVVSFVFGAAQRDPRARLEAHPAVDLYAVGVILYEALTGQYPFDPKQSLEELVPDILHKTPADPRQLNPQAPAALAELCLRLLAKRPQDRPRSARAVREELERFQAGEPAAARDEESSEENRRTSPSRRWPRSLAVLALGLVVLLALGWVLLQAEGAPSVQSPLHSNPSQVSSHPSPESSLPCTLLRLVLGGLTAAQLAGCATAPPPVTAAVPDPLDFLARCSTEARITPRMLGFQPYAQRIGPDAYWYPTFIESGTPASSHPIEEGGPVNIRPGPILAVMFPLANGQEEQEFLVTGEAFVTPNRVYIQLDRIQLPDGSWRPFCGVASAGGDKHSMYQFGVPTHAAEPAVAPLDPALVDTRPGSVVLGNPRFETFVQPADERVSPSFLRMPPPERR